MVGDSRTGRTCIDKSLRPKCIPENQQYPAHRTIENGQCVSPPDSWLQILLINNNPEPLLTMRVGWHSIASIRNRKQTCRYGRRNERAVRGLFFSLAIGFILILWIWTLLPQGLFTGTDGRLYRAMIAQTIALGDIFSTTNINYVQGGFNQALPMNVAFGLSYLPFAIFSRPMRDL